MNLQTKEFLDYLKVETHFSEYLKYERNYSDLTIKNYKHDIEKFFKFLASQGCLMEEVDSLIIRNFLTDEINSGISKRSCRRRLSALKYFYEFMQTKGYVKTNPFDDIKTPKLEKTYPHPLYPEQVEKIFKANRERTDPLQLRDQAILEFLYYTGCRVSEMVKLNVQDIDLSSRIATVIGKGNKQRLVPFTEECAKTLKAYINKKRPELLQKSLVPKRALFLNSSGEPLTARGVEYILDEVEKKTMNYVGLHPHLLRHSFATHLLENGLDIRYIQELLGHESINATQVYAHVTEKAMKDEYDQWFPRAHKK